MILARRFLAGNWRMRRQLLDLKGLAERDARA
jgi:hypothetical protein